MRSRTESASVDGKKAGTHAGRKTEVMAASLGFMTAGWMCESCGRALRLQKRTFPPSSHPHSRLRSATVQPPRPRRQSVASSEVWCKHLCQSESKSPNASRLVWRERGLTAVPPRLYEDDAHSVVEIRTDGLQTLRELGPPDLVHLVKQPSKSSTKQVLPPVSSSLDARRFRRGDCSDMRNC